MANSRELIGDRGQPKDHLRSDAHVQFQISHTITLAQERLVVAQDKTAALGSSALKIAVSIWSIFVASTLLFADVD